MCPLVDILSHKSTTKKMLLDLANDIGEPHLKTHFSPTDLNKKVLPKQGEPYLDQKKKPKTG